MTEIFSYPVVSILVERSGEEGTVLLQRRSKTDAGPFQNLWELPQGRLRYGETILECASRELIEETGLFDFIPKTFVNPATIRAESLFSGNFIVVNEVGFHSFLAICIVGTAKGEPVLSAESSEPGWYNRNDILNMISRDHIFPLNVPMLQSYIRCSDK